MFYVLECIDLFSMLDDLAKNILFEETEPLLTTSDNKCHITFMYSEKNVTGAVFLELEKDDLKEIVKEIGTVKQLQSIQSQQKKPKV